MSLRTFAAWPLLLALAGCATLSEKECRGDWEAIGRADGARGLPADELERHRTACGKHDITPDAAAWRAGREQGLVTFCTPRGGYLAGRGGETYRDVCPAAKEAAFLAAHRRGREVAELIREVRVLRQRRDDYEAAALQQHDDGRPEDRTQLRFRAEEAGQRLRIREWELERLDRRYAREFGAPELSWTDMREP
jgi:hypothetical protein